MTASGYLSIYALEGFLMNHPKMSITARNTMDRMSSVWETPTLFRREFATGVNTTVEAPNVHTMTPVAKPFLSMNHFCAQEMVEV